MNFKDSEILVAKLSKLCPGVPVDEEQCLESAFFYSIRDKMGPFKDQLRSLRKKHSKTQVEIANYLGITQAAYSGWESGSVIPKASALKELAEYYDEDPSVFFTRSAAEPILGLYDLSAVTLPVPGDYRNSFQLAGALHFAQLFLRIYRQRRSRDPFLNQILPHLSVYGHLNFPYIL